ncbi:unnamed protein product [marine sediment metagenome]|uniref:Uncharacterized protein n=1 Tax=marine sediment metagenome TaxID=412755 RepID=X1BEK9_9ZZZZ
MINNKYHGRGKEMLKTTLKNRQEIEVLAFPCHDKWRKLNGYKVFKHIIEKLEYNGRIYDS